MNNHLLPFPYNLSRPPTWLERIVQPLWDVLSGGLTQSAPKPSATPIPLQNDLNFPSIRIMCISDTHNTTPNLPPGDIIVHAGDLTAYGTFDEVQAQLYWLSSRPHTHKIFIAGNHDLILDEASNMKFLTREGISSAKRKELDWIGIHYLQDEAVTLELPVPSSENIRVSNDARNFAFGPFSILRSATCGQGGSPDDTDILVHGPPALYGDCDVEKGADGKPKIKGDGYLLREIQRIRPKMIVCGGIRCCYHPPRWNRGRYERTTNSMGRLQYGWSS